MTALSWSLTLTTPLGDGALNPSSFTGTEGISEPFHFTLVATMPGDFVDPAPLIGQPVAIGLIGGDGVVRHFHGIVIRMAQAHSTCTLEVRPWLSLLGYAQNNRIFQNKTVIDIVKAVFADYPAADFRDACVLAYDPIDYCVQFGESDFAFVSRLLEAAGIAYYFEHQAAAHTLVLVDDSANFPACPNSATVPWLSLGDSSEWLSDARIATIEHRQALVPDGYRTSDYHFVTPLTTLLGTAGGGKIYEYPGGFTKKDQADATAKRRAEEVAAAKVLLAGTSPLRHLAAGTRFTLSGYPTGALNADYVLLSVEHRAERRHYANAFTAFPAATPYRPPRRTPRPSIAGAQTAKVVGPADKEIWTDEYGRIKVQFPWDQQGTSDENSSCWIRVAQSWAGTGWGGFALPRIGQEVVVSFLDGDPDRPLVTGCVYNGTNPVPYALPDNMTRTTLKSRSTPQADGFNELRFEDKAGSEEVFLQAQKDLTVSVLNNATETVKQKRSVTVQEGDASFTVSKGNWTTKVETGNATHEVKGNTTVKVEGNAEETITGNLTIKVSGNVTIQASGSCSVEATGALSVKGSSSVAIEAGSSLTLKGATVAVSASGTGSFDGGGMLELKGGMVNLN
ncbi:type VI secretion system Vgr family protein [Sphingomonas sp. 37zxx]|uniref:type VI secretion system Vgr family protein n=1 Tax=Sphingomonas sp. 37zxx TaxID=1550073 RepID=UPI000690C07D|nr:type VI secretion system tip protein TssI/VgrG [Sphingomonas sp. 37zxx]